MDHWTSFVDLACSVFDAAGCSLALVDGDELHYIAAAGADGTEVAGLRLPVGRGIAGYVAVSGQSIEVNGVTSDPRFARDVAERIGYLPEAMLAAPLVDADGEVVGVLSVLDRDPDGVDGRAALALAAQLADVAVGIATMEDMPAPSGGDLRGLLAARITASGAPAAEQQLLHGLARVLTDRLEPLEPTDRAW